MTLPSGAHVEINSIPYMLAENVEGHYQHNFAPTVLPYFFEQLAGEPGKRDLRTGRLLWEFTDWSGGEGNRIYYDDQPTIYDRSVGGANPRIPGMLFGPPTQTTSTITATGATTALLAVGNGKVWVASGRETYYSSNGTSFSAGPVLAAGHVISAITGTEDYLYVSSLTGTTRYIYRCTTSTATEVTNQINSIRFAGMATYQGWLYGWTGRKLWAFDISQTLPLTTDAQRVKAHDTGSDPGGAWGTYAAGLVASEESLIYFITHQGHSTVYEAQLSKKSGSQPVTVTGVGRALWKPGGLGFTVQSICVQSNIVYAAGHWGTGTDNTGKAQIYALPLATMQPEELAFIRKPYSNLHLTVTAPSYGAQILLSDQTSADIFIYDAKYNAVSELDAVSEAPTSLLTWGPYRYAVGISGTTVKLHRWPDDEPTNRAINSGITLDVGNHDNILPFETKVLLGFHVGFSPMVANQSIILRYYLDDDATGTALTTITSSTTGNTNGRVFVPTSGTATYRNLKWRVVTAGTSGAQDPIVYSVTPESTILSTERFIDLAVLTRNEEAGHHPAGMQRKVTSLRSNLRTLCTSKQLVTLKDGYGYPDKDTTKYDTYTGYVDGIVDQIDRNAEGYCRVRFRVIPT